MVRIPALDPPFSPDVENALTSMMPPGVPPLRLFRTFAHNLEATKAMQPWGRYELSRNLSVDLRTRELVIDRVCARCGCDYEWGVHVRFYADKAGLTPEQIESLAAGSPADECWTDPSERAVLAMVDSLHDTADLPDELWADLTAHFTSAQVIDLMLLAGWYHAICYVATAARVHTEAGTPTLQG